MAGGSSLLDTIDREEAAAAREQRARDALLAPSPAPDEAARLSRAGEQTGLPPSIVGAAPQLRRSVEVADQMETMRGNPALQEWIANGDNAAVSADDFDILDQMSRDWSAFTSWAAREAQQVNSAAMTGTIRSGISARRWVDTNLATPEARARFGSDVGQNVDRLRRDLGRSEWWKQRGEDAERAARHFVREGQEFFRAVPAITRDVGRQYEASQEIQQMADLGWSALMGEASSEDLARLDELAARPHPTPISPFGYAAQSSVQTMGAIGQGAERATQFGSIGFATGATGALVLGQAGPQAAAPEELATVPFGALAGFGIGARYGFPVGAMEFSGRVEAGLAYSEFRSIKDESGRPLDDRVARQAALMVGAANGLLEVASVRAAVRAIPGGEQMLAGLTRSRMRELLLRPTFRDALLRAAGRIGYVAAVEGLTEAAQELVTTSGGEWAKSQDGGIFYRPSFDEIAGRVLYAGQAGAQAGSVFGGIGAGAGLAIDLPRARRAQEDANVLAALADGSERSKLRTRLPERFRNFVDSFTRDGPIDTVFVDAQRFQTFFQEQGVDPAEVADALEGVGRARYEQALAARDDFAVPLSTFSEQIAGTPAYNGLMEDIRLRPDADTLREARNNYANEERVQRQIDDLVREQELQADDIEAQQLIAADILRQLNAAGVTVPDANRMQAEATAKAYVVMGHRSGQNPIALWKSRNQTITGPLVDDRFAPPAPNSTGFEQVGPPDVEAFSAATREAHGLADLRISLQERTDDLVLDMIALEKAGQRKGAGSAAMRDIVEFADRHGLRIRLTPAKRGGKFGTTSYGRLVAFYKRFGFVENKGKAKDFTFREAMYRRPQGSARVEQSEAATPSRRFDARAVAAEDALSGPIAIPDIGTPEFTRVLETALARMEAGERLSFLEQWVLERAGTGTGAVAARTSEELYQGDEPIRARPLGASGRSARIPIPPAMPRAPPEAAAKFADLIRERDRLNREIEQRTSEENDLPEMTKARQDAQAMRAAAYCSARELEGDLRVARTIRGGVAGGAAVAGAAVVATPTPTSEPSGGSADMPPLEIEPEPTARVAIPEPTAEAVAAMPAENVVADEEAAPVEAAPQEPVPVAKPPPPPRKRQSPPAKVKG